MLYDHDLVQTLALMVFHKVTSVKELAILAPVGRGERIEARPWNYPSYSIAYKFCGFPLRSQLANFQYALRGQVQMFLNAHLIGPGIGGQAAHCPPSKVASQLRKNAKAVVLSVVLAAALASFSHSFSMSILSPNLLRDNKVGISADNV
jgi:hypothetical protein